jgi:hypothetical protein
MVQRIGRTGGCGWFGAVSAPRDVAATVAPAAALEPRYDCDKQKCCCKQRWRCGFIASTPLTIRYFFGKNCSRSLAD